MKIEEGMYCYNKINRKSGIGKIVGFRENNNAIIKYVSDIAILSIGNIVASYNIIDLIEEGDYVNGSEVVDFENRYIKDKDKFIRYGVITENCYLENNDSWITEKDIKSIVTKEVFKANEYRMETD